MKQKIEYPSMMKIEDIPISFSITPGKSDAPLIAEYRKIFMERAFEIQSFEELLTGLVKKNFLKACQRLMPLLETLPIHSIQVKLNVSTTSSSTLASYEYGKSDASAGHYMFTIQSALIIEYLANYLFDNIQLSPGACYTWEHELIHMLDHGYIAELEYNHERPDVTEILVDYILSFRGEGIAELFYFMKNHSRHRSIKAARTLFLTKMEFLRNRPWDDPLFARVARKGIKHDHDFYTIGTWMVLHVLGCEAYKQVTSEAWLVAVKIKKRQEITDEEIISMVRKALEIDNYSFINCLTKPGPDGKPFVEYEELYDLARTVELCKADMERNWSKPARLNGDPNIVRLFRLLRPKPMPDGSI
jgi:hypothetical protein